MHLETGDYHSHSVSSHWVLGQESRFKIISSPCWAICRNASSHPLRGLSTDLIIKSSFCTCSSTVPFKRHCSNNNLGIRIPQELPIRIMLVFIVDAASPLSNYIVITIKQHHCQCISLRSGLRILILFKRVPSNLR